MLKLWLMLNASEASPPPIPQEHHAGAGNAAIEGRHREGQQLGGSRRMPISSAAISMSRTAMKVGQSGHAECVERPRSSARQCREGQGSAWSGCIRAGDAMPNSVRCGTSIAPEACSEQPRHAHEAQFQKELRRQRRHREVEPLMRSEGRPNSAPIAAENTPEARIQMMMFTFGKYVVSL